MPARRTTRIRHLLAPAAGLALAGLIGLPSLASIPSAGLARATPSDGVTPVPADVERVVAGDMVVDWIGGAPEGAAEALSSSGVPTELTIASVHEHDDERAGEITDLHAAAVVAGSEEVTDQHAGATGGYALFSSSARWLPTGYTIRLAGDDRRVEEYRDEVTEAARSATTLTGRAIRVAPAFGGSSGPARGEIVVVLGVGPCGSNAAGCGGPGLTARELVHGRVWLHPSALGLPPAQRTNLLAHELGHALGLQHFGESWTDGRQVMYPVVTTVAPFRAGDTAGLRRVAGGHDRPAGTVTARTYAAGWANVAGTVTSGSRVRIAAGSVAHVVTATAGRFHGAIPLPAGTHTVCATSLDAAPGFGRDLGCGTLDAPGKPMGHLDGASGSFTSIRVSGWAIDPQTSAPVSVQVRRDGTVVAGTIAGADRGDLGELAHAYGRGHGFAVDVPATPGLNRLCVRILGVGGGGDRDAGCVDVVHAVDPTGVLDAVEPAGLGATVSGWALDPNSPDPVHVAVLVDGEVPVVGGTARASAERPDVGRSHPAHGSDLGFSHRVPMGPGAHEVCVTVVNVGLGKDRSLGCRRITIEDATTALIPTAVAGVEQVVGLVGDAATAPVRVVEDLQAALPGR